MARTTNLTRFMGTKSVRKIFYQGAVLLREKILDHLQRVFECIQISLGDGVVAGADRGSRGPCLRIQTVGRDSDVDARTHAAR